MYSRSVEGFPNSIITNYSTTLTLTGKYKFDLRGEKGYYYSVGYEGGAGGTMIGSKFFSNQVTLQIRVIAGNTNGARRGGSGVGLLEGGTIKMFAGGGPNAHFGGGGYAGGYSALDSKWSGYSWNGSKGSSYATSGAGTGGYISGVAYGGTGYCASDYSCSGTFATNSGSGSVTITYCGPKSNSACP